MASFMNDLLDLRGEIVKSTFSIIKATLKQLFFLLRFAKKYGGNILLAIPLVFSVSVFAVVFIYCFKNGFTPAEIKKGVCQLGSWFDLCDAQSSFPTWNHESKKFYDFVRDCILALAGASTMILACVRSWSAQSQARTNEKRHATDQLMRATYQMSNPNMSIRIAGILALWKLAKTTRDQIEKENILDRLCAFVRNPVPDSYYMEKCRKQAGFNPTSQKKQDRAQNDARLREDLQAVLDLVCKNSNELKLEKDYLIDFHDVDLRKAQLTGANLKGANLNGAHLEGASMRGARLNDADLRCARLNGANLINAHLDNTVLHETHFTGAIGLTVIQLSKVKLIYQSEFPSGMEDELKTLKETHPYLFRFSWMENF